MEVGIRTNGALPYRAGQYLKVQFNGYPSRPFSFTYPLQGDPSQCSIWLHVRRMKDGLVTSALGRRIMPGHQVKLVGPLGSAYFRPNLAGRMILVGTHTGFAPIWSIAVAALRENPTRTMMIIAGGRTPDSLYMAPALARLAQFPNVLVVPVCSTPQTVSSAIRFGRPTNYLPDLHPSDVLYACGAPGMVASIQAIAARSGAICHADPFLPSTDGRRTVDSARGRANGVSSVPAPRIQRAIAFEWRDNARRPKRRLKGS
jgi:3-phenylpropionate/trans-cinnamate dioxygenase ferredoxin reductase subunit